MMYHINKYLAVCKGFQSRVFFETSFELGVTLIASRIPQRYTIAKCTRKIILTMMYKIR